MQKRAVVSRRESADDFKSTDARRTAATSSHHTVASERVAPKSSAAPTPLLSAVSPQHAWCEQLKKVGATDNSVLRDGKWIIAAQEVTPTGQVERSAAQTTDNGSSVDRILKSSVKHHTYTYAPSRPPFTLETARSPYASSGGADERVRIRRDVKDSVAVEE